MHEPRICCSDEPTVGLDPAVAAGSAQLRFTTVKERGLGVLWATHLVEERERADRVVILHRGGGDSASPTT